MDNKIHPSWTVKNDDGTNKSTLIHCFLKRTIIDLSEELPDYIDGNLGLKYKIVWDKFSIPFKATQVEVIISFQSHSYGNFALIRNHCLIPKILK